MTFFGIWKCKTWKTAWTPRNRWRNGQLVEGLSPFARTKTKTRLILCLHADLCCCIGFHDLCHQPLNTGFRSSRACSSRVNHATARWDLTRDLCLPRSSHLLGCQHGMFHRTIVLGLKLHLQTIVVQRIGIHKCLPFSFPFPGIKGLALVGLSLRLALALLHGIDPVMPVILHVVQTFLALALGLGNSLRRESVRTFSSKMLCAAANEASCSAKTTIFLHGCRSTLSLAPTATISQELLHLLSFGCRGFWGIGITFLSCIGISFIFSIFRPPVVRPWVFAPSQSRIPGRPSIIAPLIPGRTLRHRGPIIIVVLVRDVGLKMLSMI